MRILFGMILNDTIINRLEKVMGKSTYPDYDIRYLGRWNYQAYTLNTLELKHLANYFKLDKPTIRIKQRSLHEGFPNGIL